MIVINLQEHGHHTDNQSERGQQPIRATHVDYGLEIIGYGQ